MKQTLLDRIKSFSKEEKMTVNTPLLLTDPNKLWLVEQGRVNVSSVKIKDGKPVGKRSYFLTAGNDQILMGIAPTAIEETQIGLVAEAYEETIIHEASLSVIRKIIQEGDLLDAALDLVSKWIDAVFYAIIEGSASAKPQADIVLGVGEKMRVESGNVVSTAQKLIWCKSDNLDAFIVGGFLDIKQPNFECYFPLSKKSYFLLKDEALIETFDSKKIIGSKAFWHGLTLFHNTILAIELEEQRKLIEAETKRLIQKYEQEEVLIDESYEQVKKVFEPEGNGEDYSWATNRNPFLSACSIVAKHEGISISNPPNLDESNDPLGDIIRYSRFRYREVLLEGDWYHKEGNALLGFENDTNKPIALIPHGKNRYMAYNPSTNEQVLVNSVNVKYINTLAYMFYKPLPAKVISLREVVKFAFRGDKQDYIRLVGLGFSATLLGMITPILTGVLFDGIIPNAEKGQLGFVGLALFMASLAAILFEMTKSFAFLRIEGKMDSKLQAAVWDRLLDLPTSFFRKFSAGDLATRSMGISRIRAILSGVVASSLIGSIFSSLNLVLLFYYSTELALIALLLVLIHVGVMYGLGRWQLSTQRDFFDFQGKTSGVVLQLLAGVVKFRVSGTESRAFRHWMKYFLQMKKSQMATSKVRNIQYLFNSSFSLFTTIVIYFFIIKILEDDHMTTGEFLAFSAAYSSFVFAMTAMGESMLTVLQVFPIFDRTRPILEELPENDSQKVAPEGIRGNIEVSHVGFRYDKDEPKVLDDISISIQAGDYIALVGESGSGKSTLVRLLLGFEKPDSGSIMFDGQDVSSVDTRMLRQHVGVVLQDGQLIPGDIYTNIVGSSVNLSQEDAWEAARLAAFDNDVKQMPMGMHTVINEGGSTLSGGQKQRLMIARAIVHRPKILIFDEATSALDNKTQAIVTDSLNQLLITRIVVAHRLTTIMEADRIYFLKNGKISEQGSYDELMELNKDFAQLAKRQLV